MSMEKGFVEKKSMQFCKFIVEGKLFGVRVNELREINSVKKISPIHHAPESVLGYVNIRGQIHLVVDVRPFLNLPVLDKKDIRNRKVLIFKSETHEPVGLVVDQVVDITEISLDLFEPEGNPSDSESRSEVSVVHSICKLDGQLMFQLDMQRIIDSVESQTYKEITR